jgi:hypothetical protein
MPPHQHPYTCTTRTIQGSVRLLVVLWAREREQLAEAIGNGGEAPALAQQFADGGEAPCNAPG